MSEGGSAGAIEVRRTGSEDFPAIEALCRQVYPDAPPWTPAVLATHLRIFPDGQLVAIDRATGELVGMAASLIVRWDDYDMHQSWRDFTDNGWFRNHDPSGRTLYGAEVMVRPGLQGRGVGKAIYKARRELVQRLGLLRIRAGARLRHYHRFAAQLTPEAYVRKVVCGELGDPTLSFQLRQGFHVLGVVHGYIGDDPESLGYAAIIEWINPDVATPADYAARRLFAAECAAQPDLEAACPPRPAPTPDPDGSVEAPPSA